MNYWKKVIAKDTSTYNENLEGKLILIGDINIKYLSFKYAIISNRKYTSSTSVFPGEFILPTETIYTTSIDLPFTKDSCIKLDDGSNMTIRDIENVLNLDTGKLKAYIIYLEGGVPNELN